MTSPWRAERLFSELQDSRLKLKDTNDLFDRLMSYIDLEVASAKKKEAALKSVKASTAAKAVAATMLLTPHKCVSC